MNVQEQWGGTWYNSSLGHSLSSSAHAWHVTTALPSHIGKQTTAKPLLVYTISSSPASSSCKDQGGCRMKSGTEFNCTAAHYQHCIPIHFTHRQKRKVRPNKRFLSSLLTSAVTSNKRRKLEREKSSRGTAHTGGGSPEDSKGDER